MQNKKIKLIKELWQKAEDTLHAIYGDMPDLRILNRFYAEKMIYGKSDNIIFWDLIAELRIEAKIRGDLTRLSSTCFVANLMGASEINPIDLHYFCPNCKNVEFVNERLLPWDLPSKRCECGSDMRPDGFGIPYELHIPKSAPWIHLSVASSFVEIAEKIIREKAQGIYRICKLTKSDFDSLKLVFLPFDGNHDFEENVDTDVVSVGVTVTVLDVEFEEELTYMVVGPAEADPMNGLISDDSPVGRALVGAKIGDIVTAEAPVGELKFKIVNISK